MGGSGVSWAVLAVAVAVTWAAIPGPKDRRYPDYIVDPPVTCSGVGSFHHPRNCSWYYRCVERPIPGFYWTFHFECEPGTVFHDELDQCVHPYTAPTPCGSEPPTQPACTSPHSCRQYDMCQPHRHTKTYCQCQGCPVGTLYNLATKTCERVQGECTCDGSTSCRQYDFCKPYRHTKTYCACDKCQAGTLYNPTTKNCEAISEQNLCTDYCRGENCETVCVGPNQENEYCASLRCGNSPLYCDAGLSFDMATKKCVVKPADKPQLCGGFPCSCVDPQEYERCFPNGTRVVQQYCKELRCDLRTTNVKCSAGQLYNYDESRCEDPDASPYKCIPKPITIPCTGQKCQSLEFCSPTRHTREYCEELKCDLRSNTICPPGKIFDMQARKCVDWPVISTDLCPPPAHEVDESISISVPCSTKDLRPYTDQIGKLHCTNYALCDGSTFKGFKQLCRAYYECYKRSDGRWDAEERTCPINLEYNYKEDKCQPTPTVAERCVRASGLFGR